MDDGPGLRHENVLQVPGKYREEFVAACKDPAQSSGLRIMAEDEEGWVVPTESEINLLGLFVQGRYAGHPDRYWIVSTGVRYGWNKEGVFIHADHHKRYFGLLRACAPVGLRAEVPEQVPSVIIGQAGDGSETQLLLSKLITQLPSITGDMRAEVFKATFHRSDTNGNGVLSRNELGTMFRRVVNTMSAKDIEELMLQADTNGNNELTYEEFVAWLKKNASSKVATSLHRSIGSETALIKATFRVWDQNGDGLVARKELEVAVKTMCQSMSEKQVRALIDLMDVNHDGRLDYEEFVDFLFSSRT